MLAEVVPFLLGISVRHGCAFAKLMPLPPVPRARYSWEDSDDDELVGETFFPGWADDRMSDDEACTSEDAAEELLRYLCDLKRQGVLRAKHVCIISYWATKAGCPAPLNKMAKEPGKQTGKYSAHFDAVLGLAEDD